MYQLPSAAELTKNVSEANNKSSGFKSITESGKYLLQIDVAEWFTSNGGAKGIRFHITSENEQTARIELYYAKKDGSRNDFSANKLDAIMVCCGVKQLTEAKDSVMKWDKESKSMIEVDVNSAPELKGKWLIGLIQIEKDAYDNGFEIKEIDKHNLYGVFQKQTDLSAYEIMTKVTVPSEINEVMDSLDGFKVKYTDNHKRLIGGQQGSNQQQSGSYKSADDEDGLPF